MKKLSSLYLFYWILTLNIMLITLISCSGMRGTSGVAVTESGQLNSILGKWTWVSGDSKTDQRGVYGTQGVATAENKPGALTGAVSWIDRADNLWLFGGYGRAGRRVSQYLNDLWKFDGRMWTWVSGDQRINRVGEYGDRGIAASTNIPGARRNAVGWTDTAGNLWLFGGRGHDQYGADGYLNDLWKFDGTNWLWIAGDNMRYEMGDYGTKGVAALSNKPGARSGAISWIDSNGNFWLFGGHGFANVGWKEVEPLSHIAIMRNSGVGYLNDLWKFDGTNWTWVSGDSKTFSGRAVGFGYTESPSARIDGVSWLDQAGNLWLFGGNVRVQNNRVANDLWKFDGTKWVQVFAGIERKERRGVYGTKGVVAETNTPPARNGAVGWTDSEGTLWLFGGQKISGRTSSDYFNDLWKFEP
jgi:N-acetylneuraminic acid mutarotase